MTSEPTKALLAAAAKQLYHITFGGTMQFHLASDVAQQFIEVAFTPSDGAYVFNLGTEPRTVQACHTGRCVHSAHSFNTARLRPCFCIDLRILLQPRIDVVDDVLGRLINGVTHCCGCFPIGQGLLIVGLYVVGIAEGVGQCTEIIGA